MPRAEQLAVSAGLTRAILAALDLEHTREGDALLREAGIEPALLQAPDRRIPFPRQQALWGLAVAHSRRQPFSLHFARCIQPTSFGLPAYMAMNCHTLGESFDAIVRYQDLAGEGGEFSRLQEGGRTVLSYTPVDPGQAVTAQRVEAMLAATVSVGRWLVGADYRPQRVEFRHARPSSTADYEEFFGCPVRFDAPRNALSFSRAVAALKVPNASPELLQLLRERGDRLLQARRTGGRIADRVAGLLATQLSNSVPHKSRIAAQLGMSERTLQRRLREEGTSYQAILEETRHELARELLRDTDVALAQVAAQLGFSEPSTFFRAFRRREGVTPGRYRRGDQCASATR